MRTTAALPALCFGHSTACPIPLSTPLETIASAEAGSGFYSKPKVCLLGSKTLGPQRMNTEQWYKNELPGRIAAVPSPPRTQDQLRITTHTLDSKRSTHALCMVLTCLAQQLHNLAQILLSLTKRKKFKPTSNSLVK